MNELNNRSGLWRWVSGGLIAASLAAPGFTGFATAADTPAPAPAVTAQPVSFKDLSSRSWQLASDGQLQELWQQVLAIQPAPTPAVALLQKQVDEFQTQVHQQSQKTLALYNKKLAKVRAAMQAGDLHKALVAAVEASGLATDLKALQADPQVEQVVKKADKLAEQDEHDGQWVRALSLYRNLELLYDNDNRYKEPMKRAARHVAILRLYAPQVLFDLYTQEAKANGEEAPEPWDFSEDTWQRQLEGIEPVMLTESLALAARQHVEECSFEQLLLGSIDQLEILIQTKGLEKTFPSLGDPAKTRPMLDYLAGLRKDLATRAQPMGFSDAVTLVANIGDENKKTIDLPEPVIVHEMGDGATGTLDEFTALIWPHEKSQFERTTRGAFSGVGIQISLVNRQLTVVTPVEDSPAQQAGIRAGDKIVSINGKSTVGIDLESAVDKITGPDGTKVTLGIQSTGDEKPRKIELTRSRIKVSTIKGWRREGNGWDYYIDPAEQLGYIRLTQFGPDTAADLDSAVFQMQHAKGLRGLILDLRFDPGGRLDAAIAVANRFISSGVIVSTTQKTFLGKPWEADADDAHTYPHFPVIVLINRGSASAAEIVSGCLQDHHRALIVGENSFGKGSVQNLFRLDDDKAYLKLTTQYYRLPNGQIIHRRPGAKHWGIHPDVTVKMTDPQLAREIKARMLLDIVQDKNQHFDPKALITQPKHKDGDDAEASKIPNVTDPDQLLTKGLDPQLDTALLLLKTRTLAANGG